MKLGKISTVITVLSVATMFDLVSVARPAAAANLTGLTEDNTLVFFDSAAPSSTTSVRVTGADLNGTLIGIDYRPADSQLYGIANDNNIFNINPGTGEATRLNTLTTPFTAGGFSGVDFSPAADSLRLTGTNDQNFRVLGPGFGIGTGGTGPTFVSETPAYAVGDPNAGVSPTITGSAYTNSTPGSAAIGGRGASLIRTTQLYDIDSNLDVLALRASNEAILATVGSLGVDFGPIGGFDIFSPSVDVDTAFAAFGSPSNNTLAASLYTIDLSTGEATSLGQIGSGAGSNFIGLAAEPVPEPSAVVGTLALGALGTLAVLKRKQKRNVKV